MVFQECMFRVADNSGFKTLKLIKVLKGSYRRTANIGDLIVTAVQVRLFARVDASTLNYSIVTQTFIVRICSSDQASLVGSRSRARRARTNSQY